MKHTPGPWKIGKSPKGLPYQLSIEPSIGCAYGSGDEVKANARLMAAAPDMYEALRAMFDDYAKDDKTVAAKCYAAFVKAGQT
jgi:hypothetical protein